MHAHELPEEEPLTPEAEGQDRTASRKSGRAPMAGEGIKDKTVTRRWAAARARLRLRQSCGRRSGRGASQHPAQYGRMFWVTRKRLSGSYICLTAARRV